MRSDIVAETGRVLRRARQARGLTLRDVGARSNDRFKPTAVAGYERGERGISLERFCDLARLYGMAPERLLSEIMWHIGGRPNSTIDRRRISKLPSQEQDVVAGFIQQVSRLRGSIEGETITLRIGDLEVLATVAGHRLDEFLAHLRPALVT